MKAGFPDKSLRSDNTIVSFSKKSFLGVIFFEMSQMFPLRGNKVRFI